MSVLIDVSKNIDKQHSRNGVDKNLHVKLDLKCAND